MPSMIDHDDETAIQRGARGRRVSANRWLRLFTLLASRRYVVRGDSMRPTLEPGQHLLVARVLTETGPSRGDLVVVRDPRASGRRDLKRVVGLPGEEVHILDGTLLVDEVALEESYLGGLPSSVGLGDRGWTVGQDEYFLLGDNRSRSTDSREHGPVNEDLIIGRAWFRYWPLSRWGRVS